MEGKNLPVLAQLLSKMKEASVKLENALKIKDEEQIVQIKRNMLEIQKRIHELT